ncbi:unnamed protein product (macronuclear) [Paramecium tetraurelia]|uniref:RNA helicase n=1 Tax=Paramecium tetraurelia TaxID=5888 RepID=A0BDT5_PARTE|nr:uncharacterized protein GSPATT00027732001 [Paramecium tetraurelia]CAK56702.1 unnamed protein product [Paramecium tetraurelia]|eukprot:XP_001424100.1 hypothetical protein (macronuclear) [Paramecium tetraurelia strain d4-2]
MNSHYFKDLDEYELDNEESIRPRWKETRESKIGMDSQNLQPFRKELLHVQDSIMLPKTTNDNYKMTDERLEAFYREKEIIIKTFENQKVPPPFLSWASAGFPIPILESIEQLQFKSPTIIQSVVFPIILAGYDVIGIAQTGSGKTIAYLLPGLIQITSQKTEELNNTKKQNGPQMLILVPTRELAMQIESEIQLFTQNYRLKTLCIYGGINNRKNQFYNLGRFPNILVATPGRLLDFLREGATTLANVSYLVIDEADRLLELGFEDTIREIVQQIRFDRQTVFFSATWPKAVKDLAFDFCQYSPIYVQIGKSNLTINKNIDQEIICLFQKDKLQKLLDILDTLKISDKVLIFSEQKQRCEQLSINMADKGYYTIALHGDKTQPQRDEIMKAFRSGYTRLLCATDLASRGLDVTDITVVINYDFPKYFDDYIHRIGRTGRGEKKGKAFSFLAYDKDEPRIAKELLKLAQVANLKYDDSALQNFAIGIFPQMRNDFEYNRFKQQQSRDNNQRVNFQFSKNSQEQYHYENQKSRYPQDNRGSQGENNNYSKYSNIQKEDGSNGDSNYNFRFKDKFQDQQYNRDQYQGRNQWKEYGNQKDYRYDNDQHRSQNYYQNGDRKQFYGKQDRFDNRQQRQEQPFEQNKYNNDQKERYYETGRQERQFRQQGQDWSQNGQDKQENGEDKQTNRYDRPKWQQFQENQDGNYRQDKFDRFNKKQQYDNRQYKHQEDDKGLQNDRSEKAYRQYDRQEPSNRENRRVNFTDQNDDRYENNQQQYQSRFPPENNSNRWDNQKSQKQQDYWNNNKRQYPYQQRFNGGQNNPRSFDNQGEDFKNSRQEESKRQYTNQADEGSAQEWKPKQQENNDMMKNQKDQVRKHQVRFDVEDDRQHQFNNTFRIQEEDNKRNYKQSRSCIRDRHDDSRSQTFRNNDSINHHNQSQGRNYLDQNERRRNENFRDTRFSNNQQFDQYNNSRKQYDNQNRINRNQIEQNGNEDNKLKTFRNTQSLERNQQMQFYNSKQITRNTVKTDDQLNLDQQQRQVSNNIWRNRNNDLQQNQEGAVNNQEIDKPIKNSDEDKGQKIQSQIIQKQQEMEEINELQEYNFNYDPNQSSDDGEIEDEYDKIEQENNQIDKQLPDIQNHNIGLQSKSQTSDQIRTVIIQEQQDEKIDQVQIVEDDTQQIKSNINEREQDNVEDGSDNEFDFTRFSRTIEQENRLKFEDSQQQHTNNNRAIKNEEEEEVKVDPKQE